jgi:hypothetical protein
MLVFGAALKTKLVDSNPATALAEDLFLTHVLRLPLSLSGELKEKLTTTRPSVTPKVKQNDHKTDTGGRWLRRLVR